MLLHVWVGLIRLLSPEQFPLGQCGRLVLAISPTEPVKCPAQTESFYELIGLRFFEGGWQISLMSDIELNDIKIHEKKNQDFMNGFCLWLALVAWWAKVICHCDKPGLPKPPTCKASSKPVSALKVPAIFGRSQETTKSTFVLEVEDTHCRIVAIEDGPWFLDSKNLSRKLDLKGQSGWQWQSHFSVGDLSFDATGLHKLNRISQFMICEDIAPKVAQIAGTSCATTSLHWCWKQPLSTAISFGPKASLSTAISSSEVMITGGMKCIREARSRWGCPAYRDMTEPETGDRRPAFFLPIIVWQYMTIFNSFISLKLHFAANRLDSPCGFDSIQSLLKDSKCHLCFSSLVVLFCRPALLDLGFSNTLSLAWKSRETWFPARFLWNAENFPIQGVVRTTSKHDAGIQLAFLPGSLAGEL